MRFDVLIAAAAVMVSSGPAYAAEFFVRPKAPIITFAELQTCPTRGGACTITDPGPYTPREFSIDLPGFDGTYNFTGISGFSSSAGIMSYDATFVFKAGSLISNLVNFTFMSAQSGSETVRSTTIRGFYQNTTLFNPATGAIITPVPEPSTWAMMILGMGAAGWVLRRRKSQTSRFLSVTRP